MTTPADARRLADDLEKSLDIRLREESGVIFFRAFEINCVAAMLRDLAAENERSSQCDGLMLDVIERLQASSVCTNCTKLEAEAAAMRDALIRERYYVCRQHGRVDGNHRCRDFDGYESPRPELKADAGESLLAELAALRKVAAVLRDCNDNAHYPNQPGDTDWDEVACAALAEWEQCRAEGRGEGN